MKNLTKIAAACALAGSMTTAHAGFDGTITLTPTTQNVLVGQTVTMTYTMDFTGNPTIGGGTDFFFDSGLLQFVGWTFDAGFTDRDTAFDRNPDDCSTSADPNCSGPGEANGLGWGDFGGLEGPYVVGTIEFIALAAGTAFVSMAASEDAPPSNPGPFFGTSNNQQNVGFFGAGVTISAVPVPAAAWLLLSAVGGLLGFNRKPKLA